MSIFPGSSLLRLQPSPLGYGRQAGLRRAGQETLQMIFITFTPYSRVAQR